MDERKQELLQELNNAALDDYVMSVTSKAPRAGRDMYICPLCGSGTGPKHTGAFSVFTGSDGKRRWHCFSCGQKGDLYDLIEAVEGLTDMKDKAGLAADLAGITLPEDGDPLPVLQIQPKKEAKGDFAEYLRKCHNELLRPENEPVRDLLDLRGINEENINRYGIGYDREKGAISIPYNPQGSYYILRHIDPRAPHKYSKPAGTKDQLFFADALYSGKPVFICEGAFDALAVMIASGQEIKAVALGGTGHSVLMEKLKERAPEGNLVISLDNDEAGRRATKTLCQELNKANIPFTIARYSNSEFKDANEYWTKAGEDFRADLGRIAEEAKAQMTAEQAAKLEGFRQASASQRINAFVGDIEESVNTPCISTGFPSLDTALDTGIYAGLYIIGALSSLGKTTFLLQLADAMAEAGHHVLYFSLEMSANELIAKSISRNTYRIYDRPANAATVRDIMDKRRYTTHSKDKLALIAEAEKRYKENAKTLYIFEGIGDIGAKEITDTAKEYYALTGESPIIFIDYLQILAPMDIRASDKQNTDKCVLELKRLSRDLKTPVIALSSLNRESYKSEISMAAFKESGAIEYGSDVLMALQPQGMAKASNKADEKANDETIERCKAEYERALELVILKNRNAKTGDRIGFTYWTRFNIFKEDEDYNKSRKYNSTRL